MKSIVLLLALSVVSTMHAQAQVSENQATIMKQLIASYGNQAKATAAAVAKKSNKPIDVEDFSVENGRQIYLMSRNWEGEEQPACAACHTDNPKSEGKHAQSKKPIKPLAPAANLERFTNVDKVEKNFAKHCRDLYSRDCTPMEKGHFLTYLLSVK
jgi:mono/diheme cytochrome c family protein